MTKRLAVVAVLVAGLLSGCLFGPGKEQVRDAVVGMPGVTGAKFPTRETGVLTTVTLPELLIRMAAATPEQIRAVLDIVRNNPHEDVEAVAIDVSSDPWTNVKHRIAGLDVDQFMDDVDHLAQLGETVGPDSKIEWTREHPRPALALSGIESSLPAALVAIRNVLDNDVQVRAELDHANRVWQWNIQFPFSPAQERHVHAQLEAFSLPIQAVVIEAGVITELNVAVTDIASAADELSDVITAVGAGGAAPLMLTWHVGERSYGALHGSVHVGGCDYTRIPDTDYLLSPEQKALRDRLRSQFDTC